MGEWGKGWRCVERANKFFQVLSHCELADHIQFVHNYSLSPLPLSSPHSLSLPPHLPSPPPPPPPPPQAVRVARDAMCTLDARARTSTRTQRAFWSVTSSLCWEGQHCRYDTHGLLGLRTKYRKCDNLTPRPLTVVNGNLVKCTYKK